MEGAHDVMHMYISNVGQKLNGGIVACTINST